MKQGDWGHCFDARLLGMWDRDNGCLVGILAAEWGPDRAKPTGGNTDLRRRQHG